MPKGKLTEKMEHTSNIYPGMKSNWWIYVPAQYNPAKPSPVMIWQDGEVLVNREEPSRAQIVFDKFHVMKHLGAALDQVRKMEYRRLSGKDRSYIKGQKYTLLSNRENLTLDGRKALAKAGFDRAKEFTWDSSAEVHIAAWSRARA